jgi:hypothetical protein
MGHAKQAEGQRQVARPISIFDITPDRTQPRRAIPEALRGDWNGQPAGVPGLLDRMLRWKLEDEKPDHVLDMFRRLVTGEASDDERRMHEMSTDERESVMLATDALVSLATEVYRDGLINPITVAQDGEGYRLETGERRWLSFHLLHLLTGDEKWAKIPARLVERVDRFRQAAENSQRADLNMVARARQWSLLMMDAWEQHGRSFAAYEDCASDRAYYAQVQELYPPDNMGAAIMSACGVTSRAALSKYRDVLRLSDEQWQQADENNWAYGKIEGALTAVNTPVKPVRKPAGRQGIEREVSGVKKLFRKSGQGDRQTIIQQSVGSAAGRASFAGLTPPPLAFTLAGCAS